MSAPFPTPGKKAGSTDQADVLDSLPGHPSSACAVVGTHPDIRSGSFAAGNFRAAGEAYRKIVGTAELPEVSLYLIPQNANGMRSVTVTVDPTAGGASRTVTSKSVEQAAEWSYFAVSVPVAAPGGYRLTAVSGTNRGCFDVTFAK